MPKKPKCQWCGIGFGPDEEPVYDPTIPAAFRKANPYHSPCLRRSRGAQRRTMRLLTKRMQAALRDDDPAY